MPQNETDRAQTFLLIFNNLAQSFSNKTTIVLALNILMPVLKCDIVPF